MQNGAIVTREVGEKKALGALAALDANAALRTVTAKEPVRALKLGVEDWSFRRISNWSRPSSELSLDISEREPETAWVAAGGASAPKP